MHNLKVADFYAHSAINNGICLFLVFCPLNSDSVPQRIRISDDAPEYWLQLQPIRRMCTLRLATVARIPRQGAINKQQRVRVSAVAHRIARPLFAGRQNNGNK